MMMTEYVYLWMTQVTVQQLSSGIDLEVDLHTWVVQIPWAKWPYPLLDLILDWSPVAQKCATCF